MPPSTSRAAPFRRRPPSSLRVVLLGGLLVAVQPSLAWGYVDPVAGTAVLQAIVGAVLAGAATMWSGWSRVAGWIRTVARRLLQR